MADNIDITPGSGATAATDEIGGIHYQKVKPVFGANDTATTPSTGSGTTDSGTLRVVIPTDQAKIPVHGDVAHDGADAGSPVKIGGYAITAERTAVAAADRVDFIADVTGKQIVLPYANPENFLNGSGNATGVSDTAIIAAQSAGVRIYVTTLIIYNSSTTSTYVQIKDGSTAKLVVPAPAQSGAIITLSTPFRGSAATALNFASGTSVSTMYVSAVGYKGV